MAKLGRVLAVLKKEQSTLEAQLQKIRGAIGALQPEGRRAVSRGRKRLRQAAQRGRKMTAAQRRAVSRRMKAYWAARRKG